MSSVQAGNSTIRAAMADLTTAEYDALPAGIKLVHSREGYAWLGSEKRYAVERECNPDEEVTE
jgi:hypothetical protein